MNRPAVIRSPTSPRFDSKAKSATFGLSYFPYIFSAWVVFMSTFDTFHSLDLWPRYMPVGHTTGAQTLNAQLIVGLALTTAFSALRFAAFQTLGRVFTYQLTILPDHKLVTHGLYSYVRHPYVFMCRAETEDQVLRKEFGKEWEDWARIVKYKFIPGVL